MRTAVLTRFLTGDNGTFGKLMLDDGFSCVTGELPWRDNMRGLSCIPPGVYDCHWLLSPTHGWCYHITGVKGRSEIEIHSANFCGDRQLGKQCELRGCIALGVDVGMMEGQTVVLHSQRALQDFHSHMNGAPLQLVIHGVPEKKA